MGVLITSSVSLLLRSESELCGFFWTTEVDETEPRPFWAGVGGGTTFFSAGASGEEEEEESEEGCPEGLLVDGLEFVGFRVTEGGFGFVAGAASSSEDEDSEELLRFAGAAAACLGLVWGLGVGLGLGGGF